MSGPEMLTEALRLLSRADDLESEGDLDTAHSRRVAASVYMTGALATATALPGDLHQEWLAATKPTRAGTR